MGRFTFFLPLLLSWGLPGIPMLSGPYQHFRNATVSSWRGRVAGVLTSRKGFRGGPLLDYDGTKQLLFSSHLRERDKMLLGNGIRYL